VTADQKLREVVDQALAKSKDPDPHVVARKLLLRLTPAQRDEALQRAVLLMVQERVRELRANVEDFTPENLDHAETSVTVGASRWSIAQRVNINGVWKFLADCTAADCFAKAAEYDESAARLTAMADHYRALAHRLQVAGVERVGDLDLVVAA